MKFNQNADFYLIRFYDSSAATYTNRSVSGADDLFSDTFDTGDWVEFTSVNSGTTQDTHFNDINSLNIDTALVADSVEGIWEVYSNTGSGFAWRTMASVTDNTTGFTVTGNNSVDFDPYDAEYGYSFTTIRYRITAVTNPSEGGHYSAKPQKGDNVIYIENTNSYTPDTLKTWSDSGGYNVVQAFEQYGTNYKNMYRINAILKIETGGTFSLDNQIVELWSNGQGRYLTLISGSGTLNLGDGNSTGSYNGSAIILAGNGATDHSAILSSMTVNASNSSFLKSSGVTDGGWDFGSSATFNNCIIEGWRPSFSGGSINNLSIRDAGWVYITYSSDLTISDLKVSTAGYGLYTLRQYYTNWVTFDRYVGPVYQCRSSQWKFLDSQSAYALDWSGKFNTQGEVRILWRLNVKVVDINGDPISGVNVKVVDAGTNTQVNTDTDANGVITEQNVMSDKHAYASLTYTHTDYNDMEITISKTGYDSIVIKDHTFEAPLSLKVVLKTEGGGGISSGYII